MKLSSRHDLSNNKGEIGAVAVAERRLVTLVQDSLNKRVKGRIPVYRSDSLDYILKGDFQVKRSELARSDK